MTDKTELPKPPAFVIHYNPDMKRDDPEFNGNADILDYALSQLRLNLKTNPNLLDRPSLVFAHVFTKTIDHEEDAAGWFLMEFDPVDDTTPEKEKVSDLIISTLAVAIGSIDVMNGFTPLQLVELFYWLVAEENHIPIVCGTKSREPKGYYTSGIVLVHKDVFLM